jgi:hypothetical protein
MAPELQIQSQQIEIPEKSALKSIRKAGITHPKADIAQGCLVVPLGLSRELRNEKQFWGAQDQALVAAD